MKNSQVSIEITKRKASDSNPVTLNIGTLFYFHIVLPDGTEIGERFTFEDSYQIEFDDETDEVLKGNLIIANAIKSEKFGVGSEVYIAPWLLQYEELEGTLILIDNYHLCNREVSLGAKIKLRVALEPTVEEPDHETQQSELIEKAKTTLQLLYRKYS
jgi:hypothetical protein